jgi:hypothetical protein
MVAGDPYKHTVPSLETLQHAQQDAPGVRLGGSDRLTETSEGLPSSSCSRRYRRESDSTVALTWCVVAAVAASTIAACAAI